MGNLMKPKSIKYLLILIFLVVSESTYAVYGCYLPDGSVYTNLTPNGTRYRRNSGVFVGLGACLNGSNDGSCEVNNPVTSGVLGDYDVAYCPIDDYVWILVIGISGLIFIKRSQIGNCFS